MPPQYPISTNLTTRSLVFLRRGKVIMLVWRAGVPRGFTVWVSAEVLGCLVKRIL